jgi:hypothetical protein
VPFFTSILAFDNHIAVVTGPKIKEVKIEKPKFTEPNNAIVLISPHQPGLISNFFSVLAVEVFVLSTLLVSSDSLFVVLGVANIVVSWLIVSFRFCLSNLRNLLIDGMSSDESLKFIKISKSFIILSISFFLISENLFSPSSLKYLS